MASAQASESQDNTTSTDTSAQAELSAAVDDLVNTVSNKFASVSSEIFAKLDEMSRRLDTLEASILNGNGENGSGPGGSGGGA